MRRLLFALAILLGSASALEALTPLSSPPEQISKTSAVISNHELNSKLFSSLAAKNKNQNIFFSPYSIEAALNLAYAGSQGVTKAEFENLYGLESNNDLHANFSAVQKKMDENRGENTILNANALWVSKEVSLENAYLLTTKQFYNAAENKADFGKPDEAVTAINNWVAQHTNDKITKLVTAANIQPLTKLIITNAVYFYGKWENEFDKKLTKPADFKLFDGTVKQLETMNSYGKSYQYFKDTNKQMLELPYKGNSLKMLIILPDDATSQSLEEAGQNLSATIQKFESSRPEKVKHFSMPKFKFESDSISLKQNLIDLGLNSAFSSTADFKGISKTPSFYIDNVVHKAVVEVNEEGTEAAAATAIMMPTGALMTPKNEINFIVDKPFIFIIRDKSTGLVLFTGQITEPAN